MTSLREARRPPSDGIATSRSAPVDWNGGTPNRVSLLDVEPDLGRGIAPQDWEVARQTTRVTLTRVDRHDWALQTGPRDTGTIIGMIVSDGMVGREIALGEHVAFELLTPGDVLLLHADGPVDQDLGGSATLTALNLVELIVLGEQFVRAAARWPSLLTNLHGRLEAQRRRLAIQSLAAHLPRAEDRLLLTLWALAERCGRVTPEGTVLPLSLTHEVLGRLAAARRPTVTLALRNLEQTGCIGRRHDGHLTLGPAAHRRVQELADGSAGHSPIGPSVAPHRPLQPGARRPISAQPGFA